MKVGIIGGGVLGMAAAERLLEAGHQVEVFEARDELGGQVVTFPIGGELIECFYHHIFTSDTVVADLIQRLGKGDQLTWRESKGGLLRGKRLWKFVTPLDLLKFGAVPLVDRVRLGFWAWYLRRQKEWRKYESMRAKDWILKRVGRKGYEAVWGPLLRAKFAERADEVGMVWFWGKIYLRFASRPKGLFAKEKLGYLLGSFHEYLGPWTEQLRARGAQLHVSTPVQRIEVTDGRVTGVTVGGSDPRTVTCDAVLATVPSRFLPRLTPPMPDDYVQRLSSISYQWATCMVLALDRQLSPFYWLTVCDPDVPFVAVVEQTNLIEPERYGGNHVVYLSNYVSEGSPILSKSVDEVFEEYVTHLKTINPAFDRSWVREKWLFKDPAGQPVIVANYESLMPAHETPFDGLYLANTSQIYPEDRGQNYSIRLGYRVADLMLQKASGTPATA